MTGDEEADILEVLRRPLRRDVDDQLELRDLIMRYAHLYDRRQADDLLDLCTDDIERVLSGTLSQVARGRDELRARLLEEGTAGPLRSRHLITDEVIRTSDNGREAWAVAQFAVVLTSEQNGFRRGQHEGTYLFHFRRVEGGWRFARQVIISDSAHNPLLDGTI